jgi:hypothetical protein
MKFDIEHLNLEYLNWKIQWMDGRNDQDLRFGQYLDSKYDLKLHLSDRSADLFYKESCEEVYQTIYNVMLQNESNG